MVGVGWYPKEPKEGLLQAGLLLAVFIRWELPVAPPPWCAVDERQSSKTRATQATAAQHSAAQGPASVPLGAEFSSRQALPWLQSIRLVVVTGGREA